MNLIQRYALQCGLKIDKPFLYSTYFPVPFEKFITIQNSSGMDAKNYDYWQEVIDLIYPSFEKENIKIIQLGDKDTRGLNRCLNLGGKTSFHQTKYVIERSLMHVGNDSWLIHLAASDGKPTIGVYGSTSIENHGPHWGEKFIGIESHRNGNKPSFSSAENPKSINLIKPESIANEILSKLSLPEVKRDSIYIGKNYHHFCLEAIMDSIISNDFLPNILINARMDFHFDEDILFQNLLQRKYNVVTDKPININIIRRCKNNIGNLIYNINGEYDLNYLKSVQTTGVKLIITSDLDENTINKIKLDFFDFNGINVPKISTKKDIESLEKLSIYTLYKTNKFLLSSNKIFLNKLEWKNGNNIPSFFENIGKLNLDDEELFEELDFMYIFNNK